MIGDLNSPHGNNSNRLAPPTGFPAMTMPMGFVHGTLPAGLQILGRPRSEPTLLKIGYAFEQAPCTGVRRLILPTGRLGLGIIDSRRRSTRRFVKAA